MPIPVLSNKIDSPVRRVSSIYSVVEVPEYDNAQNNIFDLYLNELNEIELLLAESSKMTDNEYDDISSCYQQETKVKSTSEKRISDGSLDSKRFSTQTGNLRVVNFTEDDLSSRSSEISSVQKEMEAIFDENTAKLKESYLTKMKRTISSSSSSIFSGSKSDNTTCCTIIPQMIVENTHNVPTLKSISEYENVLKSIRNQEERYIKSLEMSMFMLDHVHPLNVRMEALKWLTKLARKSVDLPPVSQAKFILGEFYYTGVLHRAETSPAKVPSSRKKEERNKRCIWLLAPDRGKSAQLLLQAAKMKHWLAAYRVAIALSLSDGVALDSVRSFKLLKRIASQDQEHHGALYDLAYLYMVGGSGVKRDVVEAVRYFRQASYRGCVAATYQLALMNEFGIYMDKNPLMAYEYYKRAGENGHSLALYRLGRIMEYGWPDAKVYKPNVEVAFRCYWMATQGRGGVEGSEGILLNPDGRHRYEVLADCVFDRKYCTLMVLSKHYKDTSTKTYRQFEAESATSSQSELNVYFPGKSESQLALAVIYQYGIKNLQSSREESFNKQFPQHSHSSFQSTCDLKELHFKIPDKPFNMFSNIGGVAEPPPVPYEPDFQCAYFWAHRAMQSSTPRFSKENEKCVRGHFWENRHPSNAIKKPREVFGWRAKRFNDSGICGGIEYVQTTSKILLGWFYDSGMMRGADSETAADSNALREALYWYEQSQIDLLQWNEEQDAKVHVMENLSWVRKRKETIIERLREQEHKRYVRN